MIYNALGKTDLNVSILGYGCSPFGDLFGITDLTEIKNAVSYAIDNGVNYFDVSPYYGIDALAESRLGEALKGGLRQKVYLATKVGQYRWDGVESHNYSIKNVMESVEGSLKRLQTDYIDVYQAHDIHHASVEQIVDKTIPAMRLLQRQGKIRFVGITDYSVGLLSEIAQKTGIDTVLSCACYNLIDTSMDDVLLPIVREKKIGLINASPLHLGLLVDKQKRLVEYGQSHDNSLTRAVAKAAAYCRENGMNISDLALRFTFAHPYAATTLCGMSSIKNVERNLNAVGKEPDMEIVTKVMNLIKEGYDPNDPFGFSDNSI